MMWSESYVDGVRIGPGARLRHHSNLDKGPTFQIHAICEDEHGKLWHAEVSIDGHVILTTSSFDDRVAAGSAAEALLRQRLIDVFGAPGSAPSRPGG